MITDNLPSLHLATDRQPAMTIVHCAGQVDLESWSQFSEPVRALISEGKPIRVDLAGVTRVDSTGIGALVGVWAAAKRRNCELKYVNPTKRIEEVIRLTALLGMLEGQPEEERQLGAAFAGQ